MALRPSLLLLLALVGAQCGPLQPYDVEDVDPEIVGGNPATIEQYPYQVSMQHYRTHICGGSILTKRWVLTAAHCVHDASDPADVTIRYGSTEHIEGGTVVQAVWVGEHPNYVHRKHQWDVALIQVAEDIVYSTTAQPVKMVPVGVEPKSSDFLTVSGWGTLDSYDYDGPNGLYAVAVPYVPRSTCKISYSYRGYLVDDSMICAGVSGKDSCQGDSGGPLVNAMGLQAGVVSWGVGCGYPGYAGVYADLANALNREFITNKTGLP